MQQIIFSSSPSLPDWAYWLGALIKTIEENLQIADEGRRKSAEAATQLEALESELRKILVSFSARVKKGVRIIAN